MRIRTLGVIFAAVMMAPAVPAVLAAQQPAGAEAVPATHTVVKGETLWGLAARYLGSGFKWRAIYEVNREAIANPHWIYPGQVLRMPGAVTSVAVTVAPPAGAPVDTTKPRPPAAVPAPEPTLNTATGRTVFKREYAATPATAVDSIEVARPFPTVLVGEYLSAPYVLQSAKVPGAGRLIGSASLDPQGHLDTRNLFKGYDAVLVDPPSGAAGRKGEQYVVLRLGPALYRIGQVMVPTGIVQVTNDRTAGTAVRAQVIAVYGEMSPGQMLVPLDTAGIHTTVRPKPVSGGRSAEVQWVLSEPVLPTTSAFIVLNLTAGDGVKPGDEFSLFRDRTGADVDGGNATPAVAIGAAKVVRVTPFGVTAIVTAQEQAALNVGVAARLTAKMP
ncbi:MAG: LysM peptidoglycan-binding domain-containing protein [Gemmatimonadota bacterium]|nr:LysM peptidoglycan-binding domain-containing protein [Gemmatimonadota bacterium]